MTAKRPRSVGLGPIALVWEPRYYRTMGLQLWVGERLFRLWGRRWHRRTLRRFYDR